jgi:hypothetical protein
MSTEFPTSPAEIPSQPEPTLAENLATLSERTERLTAELEAYAGTNTYPDWWMQDVVQRSTVINQLKAPDADPKHVSEYFQIFSVQRDIRAVISGRKLMIDPMAVLSTDLGVEVAAKGFAAEGLHGPMHATVFNQLASATEERKYVGPELEILRGAYDKERATDLLGPADDEYIGALKPLLRTENALRDMRIADGGYTQNDTLEEIQDKDRRWMTHALSAATGMDETEAADYTFAASKQLTRDKPIVNILDKFDRFGVERLQDLAKFSGIHAVESYSVEQLEFMESLVRNPQEAAKRLAGRDVNVVMINRVGEHNGTLANAAETYEDGTGRTLFFEINNIGDIYRRMLRLHELGIKPSGLVLAAHSAAGQFMVSDKRDPSMKRRDIATIASQSMVKLVNESGVLNPGDFGYSMHGMKGVSRLVEEFMQPSRGIDDPDIGRKKILFQACHAATEDNSIDIDKQGNKFVAGMDSVITKLGMELAHHTSSNVDIYGAPGGIQLHKTKRGVRYSGMPAKSTIQRQQQYAVRIRLENDELIRQEVDEVDFHKTAA